MLTQQDNELINNFYNKLADRLEAMGIPLRVLNQHEHIDNNIGVYCVSFYFQVMMTKFELFVNTKMAGERRYGWKMV